MEDRNKPHMTPEGWRRPTDNNRHHRENGWDYKGRGIYHFTLVVAERFPLFGGLVVPSMEEAYVDLNSFGRMVLDRLLDIPHYYEQKGYALKLLVTQIMPDHIHMAIQVLEPMPQPIGTVIRGFKSACTSIYKRECYCPNDGTIMHGETRTHGEESTVHFSRIFARTGTIWEQNPAHYHERILHSDGQLRRMIAYIKDNPKRLAMKRAHPGLFRIQEEAEYNGMRMRTMGNRFLLDYPDKEVLQCSRSMTEGEIEKRKEECLAAAENGTVFVSAAISEGEKQICRALRESGYPIIILLAEGFPEEDHPHYPYYKPSGVYFEACSAGRLLLIEPDEANFEDPEIVAQITAKTGEIPHSAKRWRFLAMNAIAERIVAEER